MVSSDKFSIFKTREIQLGLKLPRFLLLSLNHVRSGDYRLAEELLSTDTWGLGLQY